MTADYVPVRLRLNIGHLTGWVLADQLDQLLATADDTGQVVPTLLVVERLRPDALPALVPG
jgi:hypothetical protein